MKKKKRPVRFKRAWMWIDIECGNIASAISEHSKKPHWSPTFEGKWVRIRYQEVKP